MWVGGCTGSKFIKLLAEFHFELVGWICDFHPKKILKFYFSWILSILYPRAIPNKTVDDVGRLGTANNQIDVAMQTAPLHPDRKA